MVIISENALGKKKSKSTKFKIFKNDCEAVNLGKVYCFFIFIWYF